MYILESQWNGESAAMFSAVMTLNFKIATRSKNGYHFCKVYYRLILPYLLTSLWSAWHFKDGRLIHQLDINTCQFQWHFICISVLCSFPLFDNIDIVNLLTIHYVILISDDLKRRWIIDFAWAITHISNLYSVNWSQTTSQPSPSFTPPKITSASIRHATSVSCISIYFDRAKSTLFLHIHFYLQSLQILIVFQERSLIHFRLFLRLCCCFSAASPSYVLNWQYDAT